MNETYVPLDRPREFTSTLSAVVDILRVTWRRLLSDIVVMSGIWMLAGGVMIGIVARSFISNMMLSELVQINAEPAFLIQSVVLVVLGFALLMTGSFMEILVTMSFFRAYHRLQRVPDRSEVRAGIRELWPRTLSTVVLMILILSVAFVCVIVPGLFLMVPFLMLIPVRTFEDLSFGNAVTRSFQLTRDRWWWTFGVYIMISVAVSVFNGIMAIPYFFFSIVIAMFSAQGEQPEWVLLGYSVSLVLQYITGFILQVITIVGIVVAYFAHRERLDGTSLLARVEQIGATDAV